MREKGSRRGFENGADYDTRPVYPARPESGPDRAAACDSFGFAIWAPKSPVHIAQRHIVQRLAAQEIRQEIRMGLLNLTALSDAPLAADPFEYVVVEGFLAETDRPRIAESFPDMPDAGSFPLSELTLGPGLEALIDELNGPAFRRVIEQKFDIDLAGAPTMFTLRGRCDARDGRIHTDSKKKIITVLLYLNEAEWGADGGRLRLLRGGEDLDDVAAEVSPEFGVLLAFKRSERSWHGHEPYVGPRRVLQMNWVVSDKVAAWEQWRHRMSAAVKRITRGLAGAAPKPHVA